MPLSALSDEFEPIEQYGRTFVRSKKYVLPSDAHELDRLDVQHALILAIMGDRLTLAPIDNKPLKNVLDIGTGSGIWATDFAKKYPSANIIGTDITDFGPVENKPQNCTFILENADTPWPKRAPFDYIHGRDLLFCFSDPRSVFQRAYDNLAPGGYFEMQDILLPSKYARPPSPDSAIQKWSALSLSAFEKGGTPATNPHHYEKWFREVGFADVQTIKFFVPHGEWADDERVAQIGNWAMLNFIIALEGWTVRSLARLGWTGEQSAELIERVKEELLSGEVQMYREWQVVYGRKPL